MSDTLLRVSGLSKRYGDVVALSGLDLELASGEVVALLGPNGAGKTTTLEILAGLLDADSGSTETSAGRSGYAPEEPAIWAELTPRAACTLMQTLYDHGSRRRGTPEARAVEELLVQLDLATYADRRAKQLSLGNRKKLNLALALVHKPKLLLLDEPFSGLDVAARDRLRRYVTTFAERGGGVLLASHELDEVCRVSDHVHVLVDGTVRGVFHEPEDSGQLISNYLSLIGVESAT